MKRITIFPGLLNPGILSLSGLFIAGGWLAFPLNAGEDDKGTVPNTCVDCHGDSDFLVRNRKLYDYFEKWKLSVHNQEGVSCVDCHGGDPSAADKDKAHSGESMEEADNKSPIYFKNIPTTCSDCHYTIYEGFKQSEHFKHLRAKDEEAQGPSCVTCHGSVNTSVLNMSTVAALCSKCHNEETGNSPGIPEEAEKLLSRFLSIQRYYRYIGVKGEPMATTEFFQSIDPLRTKLTVTWHTFNLESIEKESRQLLQSLKEERYKVRKYQVEQKQKLERERSKGE